MNEYMTCVFLLYLPMVGYLTIIKWHFFIFCYQNKYLYIYIRPVNIRHMSFIHLSPNSGYLTMIK